MSVKVLRATAMQRVDDTHSTPKREAVAFAGFGLGTTLHPTDGAATAAWLVATTTLAVANNDARAILSAFSRLGLRPAGAANRPPRAAIWTTPRFPNPATVHPPQDDLFTPTLPNASEVRSGGADLDSSVPTTRWLVATVGSHERCRAHGARARWARAPSERRPRCRYRRGRECRHSPTQACRSS
jgi:hypothetical protein